MTGATQGDFRDGAASWFAFDDSNATNGWVTINIFVMGRDLSGDLILADVTLEAIGSPGDSSPLILEIMVLADQSGYNKEFAVDNGTFTIPKAVTAPAFTKFGAFVMTGLLCAIGATTVRKRRDI
ncbi:MAG TPA: hypothetical protein EYP67_07150 [Methanosarcinales archaeon]|nr:hypothetical protein [Methanosarcinales archaeon]